MKRLEFNDIYEVMDVMSESYDNLCDSDLYPVITAYGKYDVIKELLEEFLADGFEIGGDICLETPDSTGYDKEFILYLTEDGVSVCKAFEYGKYLNDYPDVAFVHEDCNSKMLKNIESKLIFEFSINDDCDFDDEEDDECDISCDKCWYRDFCDDYDDEEDDEFIDEFDDESYCDDRDNYECDNRIRSDKIKCHESVPEKHVDYAKDKDGDLHGFSVSKGDRNSYMAYSLYTSDKLSMNDIQSLMQEKGF